MRSGKLRHRVTFQEKTATADEYGGQVVTWADIATNIAASINPLSMRELMAAQAVQNEGQFRIVTRYVSGVVPSMRIVFGERVFNIVSVLNYGERNTELQFLCSEGLAKG